MSTRDKTVVFGLKRNSVSKFGITLKCERKLHADDVKVTV